MGESSCEAVMNVPRGAADPTLHRAPLCSLDVSLEENDTFLVFSLEDGSMEDEVCLDDADQSRLRTEAVVDWTPVSHTEVLSGGVDPWLHRTLVSSEDGSMEDDGFAVDVNQTRLLRILAVMVSSVVSHTEILRGAIDPSLHRALDSIMEDFLVEVRQTRLHLLRLAQRMDETYDRVAAVDWQDDDYYECYCCWHIHPHISTIRLDIVRKIDWCHPRFHWCWSGMTDGCLLHVLFIMR